MPLFSKASAAILSTLLLALAAPLEAQQEPRYILPSPEAAKTGVQPWDIEAAERENQSRFELFGAGDRAWTSLRLVGDNRQYVPNSHPGDDRGLWGAGNLQQFGTASGSVGQQFGIGFFVGAPRSEWIKYLQEGVESLREVRGDPAGYSVLWNATIFARPKDFDSADNLIGNLLSGAQSTLDGGCQDHSASLGGALMPANLPLLPLSNCLPTWSFGGSTWLGDRPISPDSWADHFEANGPNFRFNRWQVPEELKDQTGFLGTNVATYGHFNDYNSSVLLKYGDVVPMGVGDPTREGYPLGLDYYFDAFSFTLPAVANAVFTSMLIVNNSEQLYGVAHTYDSLYVGLGPWPQRSQDGDSYSLAHLGAFVHSEDDPPGSPKCNATLPVPLIGNTCGGFGGSSPRFAQGAAGIVVLKSPIGDLRNKLFTRPGSPFNMPGHPLAGDTITFNHSLNWNFGPQTDVWAQGSDRTKFGVLSSTRENTLDGTACQDFFTVFTRWSTFMSHEWPDGDQCRKGSYTPGDWSYLSGRPFVDQENLMPLPGASIGPDTLFFHGCGPTGCPAAWSAQTWNGWSINRAGNLSQFSLGPFRLEAGDTTELLVAVYSGADSASFEFFTQGIVDFYLDLFAGPQPPPPSTVLQVDIGAGVTTGSAEEAEITLVFDDATEQWVDPFLLKFADDLETASGGPAAALREFNPGLVDRIRARAAENVSRLLIFRSCDGGSSFDSDGDCRGDPAVDERGAPVGTGWEAFAILEPNAAGEFANTFTDGDVVPGVTYLYSLVAETRGFREIVVMDEDARFEEEAGMETVGTGDGANADFSGTLGDTPISPSSVNFSDGTQTVSDDGNGNLIGDVDAAGVNTISYDTGDFDFRFAAAPAVAANVDADYLFRTAFTCGLEPCQLDTLVVAPPLLSPLSRSAGDPNVLSVYLPVSTVAGGSAARTNFRARTIPVFGRTIVTRDLGGNSGMPLDVTLTARNLRESQYVLRFGNFVRVIEFRDAGSEALDSTRVVLQDQVRTVTETGMTPEVGVLASMTVKRLDDVPVTMAGATLVDETVNGGVLTRTFEIGPGGLDPNERDASVMLLLEGGGGTAAPLLVSSSLSGDAATPGSFISNPAFPGFLVSVDNTLARSFDTQFDLNANGDTIATQLDPTLAFDQPGSTLNGVQDRTFGEYFVTYTDSVFGPDAPFRLAFDDRAGTNERFNASLLKRTRATTGVTDPEAEALVGVVIGQDTADFSLVAANIPLEVRNLTWGRTAVLAMVDGGERVKQLGVPPDSLSVTVPADQWIPEDLLYVIEEEEVFVTRDVGGVDAIVVDDVSGDPLTETRRFISFGPLNLTCGGAIPSCNPVRGPGFAGPGSVEDWIGASPGEELHVVYFSPLTAESRFVFNPTQAISADGVMAGGRSIRAQMDSIQVVPNPYIFFSQYEAASTERRIMFTHLPPDGELRIYTVAGNFVQEIDWTPADLSGNGDLFWDMQTREGNEIGGGLFIYVVTARDPANNREVKKMGKFVVIR